MLTGMGVEAGMEGRGIPSCVLMSTTLASLLRFRRRAIDVARSRPKEQFWGQNNLYVGSTVSS